jgi:tetratricopeptide (TPR) repeat protein
LPAGLTQPEREFFVELRRLVDIAGFSYRALEEMTLSYKPTAGNSGFYSKSQWSRWLNGQSMPPRNAVRKLGDILAAADVSADRLLGLWSTAIELASPGDATPREASPRDAGPVCLELAEVFPVTPAVTLVGRENELALLAGLVKQVAQGRGGVVLIEGEPGIGKSALVRAAVAEASAAGCEVFWGAGDELGQELPLLPFLDGLRVREPSANPRRRTIVRLLRGEAVTDRGTDGPAVLAEQLLALVTEQCAELPVVLVVDDLQWADPASLALWGRLARSAREVPLLLVGMTRPTPRRESLLALRRAADGGSRFVLDALTGPAVADLVAALAGGRPDEELLRLADGAAGNPLYVTELVGALMRSSGVSVTDAGVATLVSASVPVSLPGVIADRLGFVGGPVRQILRAAALFGMDFAVRDLAVVLRREVADLIPLVDQACAVGVLTEAGRGLGFRHPLIRAALYDEMPAPVRAAWHRDAGRALAEVGAPADQVARQLLRAAEESEGPPGPMDEWVLDWLTDTADSLVNQAPAVAAEFLAQAVVSCPASTTRFSWLASRLADALYRMGDAAEAEKVATRALEFTTEPDVVEYLHWTLAQSRMMTGSAAASLAALDRTLASPEITARHRARLLVLAARTHLHLGEVEEADRVVGHALQEATEAADNWAIAWALHVLTIVVGVKGYPADTLPLFDHALAATESDPALSDLRLLLRINQVVAFANLDRYDEALAAASQVRQLASQVGTTMRRTQAHSALGQLLFETGRWDDALAEVTAMDEDLKEPGAACCDLSIAAVICFHRGETAEARQHLAAAARQAERIGHRLIGSLPLARSLDREQDGALPAALAVLTGVFGSDTEELRELEDLLADAVRLAVKTGDLATARVLVRQAATPATGLEIPHRQANGLYCRALLDHDAAGLIEAAERYDDASRPLLRAQALEAAAGEFAHAGQRTQASAAFAGALEIYTALGAAADLARLRATRGEEAPGQP